MLQRSSTEVKVTPKIYTHNDDLLTECEVCTVKYLPEVFVQTGRRRSQVCAENYRGHEKISHAWLHC